MKFVESEMSMDGVTSEINDDAYKEQGSRDLILEKGVVDVTDPCYSKDTWCRDSVELAPGRYCVCTHVVDEGEWGERVAALEIRRADKQFASVDLVRVGSAGVDAGLCGFFEDKPNYDDAAWERFCDNLSAEEEAVGHYHAVHYTGEGVYSSSGYGDGEYDVMALKEYRTDEIVGLMLVFIGPDEEEEEEEEEEDDEDEEE